MWPSAPEFAVPLAKMEYNTTCVPSSINRWPTVKYLASEQNVCLFAQKSTPSKNQNTVLSPQRTMMKVRSTWSGSFWNCRSAA